MSAGGKGAKDPGLDKGPDGPVAMAKWLKDGPRAEIMDLARVKKLRMLLRHETTLWVEVFIQERGYIHLLKKLAEVVEMEWRYVRLSCPSSRRWGVLC